MDSLYLLIPIALIFAALILWMLIWAVNNGQYEDLDKDEWQAMHDDLAPKQRNVRPPKKEEPDDATE
jgi:cbb3-type cytochrome oxidase maturation protein